MRTRTTVILALALALASVWAWIETPTGPVPFDTDAGAGAPAVPPGDGIVRLLRFSSDTIQRVRIDRGDVAVILTRTQTGWEGIDDPGAVNDFLSGMQDLAQIMVFGADEGSPSDYGLAPPVARVLLEPSGAAPVELRLGNPNPTATGIYAQVGPQGPIVLTGALAMWDIEKIIRLLNEHPPQASAPPWRFES